MLTSTKHKPPYEYNDKHVLLPHVIICLIDWNCVHAQNVRKTFLNVLICEPERSERGKECVQESNARVTTMERVNIFRICLKSFIKARLIKSRRLCLSLVCLFAEQSRVYTILYAHATDFDVTEIEQTIPSHKHHLDIR